MKKIIFMIVALIFLSIAIYIDGVEQKIANARGESIIELNTLSDAYKVFEFLEGNEGEIENLSVRIITRADFKTNIEGKGKYSYNVYKDVTSYYTKDVIYYCGDLSIMQEEASDGNNEYKDLIVGNIEMYLTKDKIYLKINNMIIGSDISTTKDSESRLINLTEEGGEEIIDKWIDMTDYFEGTLNSVVSSNNTFFEYISNAIYETIEDGDNFIKKNNEYQLNKDYYNQMINILLESILGDLGLNNATFDELIDEFEGKLTMELDGSELNIVNYLSIDYNEKVNEKDIDVIGYENDEIKIFDINYTEIFDIDEKEILDIDKIIEIFNNME